METLRGALSLMLKTENANLMALLQESQEEFPPGTNVCKKKNQKKSNGNPSGGFVIIK